MINEDLDGWAYLDFPHENAEQGALALLGIGPEDSVVAPRDCAKTCAKWQMR